MIYVKWAGDHFGLSLM